MAEGAGARVIKIGVRAPNMNAIAERFVGSTRREMLDHVLLFDDGHLDSLLHEYRVYFNGSRPHQGLCQQTPVLRMSADISKPITIKTVLGGLHVDYCRAA